MLSEQLQVSWGDHVLALECRKSMKSLLFEFRCPEITQGRRMHHKRVVGKFHHEYKTQNEVTA